ncbi:pepsin/retropepsin-like aspartic protease family protein [Geomonas propionica]|uniref:Peptidase A2 domain-containing protein n=1 Tax=Geomonas propionica TaxID=2798582 RepID=A0ABS0YR31_9BACT|nr:hypothetical protein [Geomonas propionica]MBJ6800429.1 hypothetical protein [Geomonas propionica]
MIVTDYPFTEIDGNHYPLLPLIITNPVTGKSHPLYGYIDTGADYCSVTGEVAQIIGIDLKACKGKPQQTASTDAIAYEHPLQVDVIEMTPGTPVLYTTTEPAFIMPGSKIGLLGRKGFLENFVLTIDFRRRVFSLSPSS